MKPGWKTTEFWLTLAAAVAGLLGASGAILADSPIGQALSLVAGALATAGYSWSRGNAKSGGV